MVGHEQLEVNSLFHMVKQRIDSLESVWRFVPYGRTLYLMMADIPNVQVFSNSDFFLFKLSL